MANKIMRFVQSPLNHLALGLLLIAGANVLQLSNPNWAYAGYVFIGIGAGWLVWKALMGR